MGSELKEEADAERVYSAMMLTARTNGHTVPRNVGLLFFSEEAAQEILDQLPAEIAAFLRGRADLSRVLEETPADATENQYLDAVVALAREERARGSFKAAHATLAKAGEQVRLRADAAALFAGVKISLAATADAATKQRLAKEALELLDGVLTMGISDDGKAEVWFEISYARFMLGRPRSEIAQALERSLELQPDDAELAKLAELVANFRG